MCHQDEQQWTEHAALSASAKFGGPGGVVSYANRLRPVSQEVQHPVAEWGVHAQQVQLPDQPLWDDCVECWANVYEKYSGVFVLSVQVGESQLSGLGGRRIAVGRVVLSQSTLRWSAWVLQAGSHWDRTHLISLALGWFFFEVGGNSGCAQGSVEDVC